ncbi:serine hydrolase domain-containing protein [Streptomyces netropsis]|uniref:serine hydrolase domain-containing protein n=1 Tax=Streptomyces netropsis TaxID=55404 RepID=UPI0030D43BE2
MFADSLHSGADVGASVAIYLDGEPVVDLWDGYADQARTRPWLRDTITNVWSATKTMTAPCALVLADRGELDLSAPVATYWPEFGTHGKDRIEVRHLLSHTAGLPDWNQPMTLDDLCDREKATTLLARQTPRWLPGTASGYHRFTHGFLIGEVIRRICRQSIGTFFADQIAAPLDADFHIGLAAENDHRVSATSSPHPAPHPAANPRVAIQVGAYVTAQETGSRLLAAAVAGPKSPRKLGTTPSRQEPPRSSCRRPGGPAACSRALCSGRSGAACAIWDGLRGRGARGRRVRRPPSPSSSGARPGPMPNRPGRCRQASCAGQFLYTPHRTRALSPLPP